MPSSSGRPLCLCAAFGRAGKRTSRWSRRDSRAVAVLWQVPWTASRPTIAKVPPPLGKTLRNDDRNLDPVFCTIHSRGPENGAVIRSPVSEGLVARTRMVNFIAPCVSLSMHLGLKFCKRHHFPNWHPTKPQPPSLSERMYPFEFTRFHTLFCNCAGLWREALGRLPSEVYDQMRRRSKPLFHALHSNPIVHQRFLSKECSFGERHFADTPSVAVQNVRQDLAVSAQKSGLEVLFAFLCVHLQYVTCPLPHVHQSQRFRGFANHLQNEGDIQGELPLICCFPQQMVLHSPALRSPSTQVPNKLVASGKLSLQGRSVAKNASRH